MTVGVSVRRAHAGDVALLTSLRREWVEEDNGGPIVDPGFEDAFAAWHAAEGDSRTFFVVEVNGESVGMANVKHYARMPAPGGGAGAWGYVGNAYVRPEHRNGGVGAALMEGLTAWCWERFDKLRLSPMARAVPFYERQGFRQSALLQLDR